MFSQLQWSVSSVCILLAKIYAHFLSFVGDLDPSRVCAAEYFTTSGLDRPMDYNVFGSVDDEIA
jgi:hypothetical protein